jgi:hypothetical protein
MILFITLFIIFTLKFGEALTFITPQIAKSPQKNLSVTSELTTKPNLSRQSFLKTGLTAAATTLLLPTAALAEVSAGTSLPDGANQFSRVLKSKNEGKRIAEVFGLLVAGCRGLWWRRVGRIRGSGREREC